MASTYALPLNSSPHTHSHGHSRSHNRIFPSERPPSWIGQINASSLKKPTANPSNNLHSHSHSYTDWTAQLNRQEFAPEIRAQDYTHDRSYSLDQSFVPTSTMGRRRGESDLGRPATRKQDPTNRFGFSPIQEAPVASPSPPTSWLELPEALTAVLLPLPYLLASLAYPVVSAHPPMLDTTALSAQERLLQTVSKRTSPFHGSPLIQACTLSSTTLILVGILARITQSQEELDRRKAGFGSPGRSRSIWATVANPDSLRSLLERILSVLLPFYAAMQLGGPRTALVLLVAVAAGLGATDLRPVKQTIWDNCKRTFRTRKALSGVLLSSIICDFFDPSVSKNKLFLGHLALMTSILVLPPPLPTGPWSLLTGLNGSSITSKTTEANGQWDAPSRMPLPKPISPLLSSPDNTMLTLVAGGLLSVITIALAVMLQTSPPISFKAIVFSTLSVAAATALVFFALPSSLRTQRKYGLAIGCVVTAAIGFLPSTRMMWEGLPYIPFLCALSFAAIIFDTQTSIPTQHSSSHSHSHNHSHSHDQVHYHHHSHLHGGYSRISAYLISKSKPGSIVHSILIEKDSRRIAYFGMLNLAFMLVQFFYGFVSGSLGLLTDSIHMLFDCAGLAVGLAAAVMSKWPSNVRFPYGYGKVDTLSGFANGIFLMLVSVEIVFDAFERLWEGSELHRLNELLIVSVLGFLVNIVGLTAFGHAHHGHDHGGHDHGGHSHSHDNENMQGIFLHIMADALGSVAVIISTLLTKYYGWSGWDPIASCIIAVLIFLSALPLVKSSGMRLLLSLPADVEYATRNTLQELSSLRGVVGYTVPRFWLEDAGAAHADLHAHEHKHNDHRDHDHSQAHHSHDHSHEHSHDGHPHEHDHHEHGHSHTHDEHSPSHGHDHGHDHDHEHEHHGHSHGQQKVLGVIHVVASRGADLEDVRERTVQFLKGRGMDVVVHAEREGEGRCWCGGGLKTN